MDYTGTYSVQAGSMADRQTHRPVVFHPLTDIPRGRFLFMTDALSLQHIISPSFPVHARAGKSRFF